jgi:hypothetical protein
MRKIERVIYTVRTTYLTLESVRRLFKRASLPIFSSKNDKTDQNDSGKAKAERLAGTLGKTDALVRKAGETKLR